jgi:hypothetical protein
MDGSRVSGCDELRGRCPPLSEIRLSFVGQDWNLFSSFRPRFAHNKELSFALAVEEEAPDLVFCLHLPRCVDIITSFQLETARTYRRWTDEIHFCSTVSSKRLYIEMVVYRWIAIHKPHRHSKEK